LESAERIVAMATAFEALLGFPEQDKIRFFAATVNLRNRIGRGDEIGETDLRNARGEEHIRIALSLFEECIWGLLVELGKLREEERAPHFLSRSHWRTQLGLPNDLWYP
jgi:hypothetical protein